ncbi:DUF2493 domain-containing protein [Sphingobium chungbukense]|uniref:YspA cpYpsA-related SLOG domain-containing protein n=1 Tax=Sphingobium chungbukense TaxID=56193 RepID=A0A0M3AKE9_9SPHN|nr:DUF2493 domain-containing protein [Sphingobium chungbukense]KKW90315.1 hypothetical protein YP76_20125 [Sphingobium chungbukense]
MSKKFANFADLASFIASETDNHDRSSTYEHAFIEYDERAKLSPVDEAEQLDMPDPEQARAAVQMIIQTIFDVLRDTRMAPYASQLSWGFVNSFHVVAKRINDQEDDAAKELGELARHFDPSEIYAVQLEEAQLLCKTLEGCRKALECMRDHAGEVHRAETGRPYSPTRGSRVSQGVTASMIDARNYMAERIRERREQLAPTGPVVVFSGGQQWEDHELLWRGLDSIKARIPEMILVTTAQTKGCDAIAQAWAAARGVKVILYRLNRTYGNRAPFIRNDEMLKLKPVEAVVCEGSGIQMNLAQKLRQAGVPLHVVKADHQTKVQRAPARTNGPKSRDEFDPWTQADYYEAMVNGGGGRRR